MALKFATILLLTFAVGARTKMVPKVHNTVTKLERETDVTRIFQYLVELAHEVDEVKGQMTDVKQEVKATRKQGSEVLRLLQQWDQVIKEEDELDEEEPFATNSLSAASPQDTSKSPSHPFSRRTPCPVDFPVWRRRSCYALIGDRVTWSEAREACSRDLHPHAHLVAVESEAEQHFLVHQLKQEKGGVRHCDVWTSGTDSGTEGEWRWEDPSGKPIKYTYWHRNEPNNGGGAEHCLWMDWYFSWRWNDANCSKSKACYICELKREKIEGK